MSRRRNVERHRDSLAQVRNILNSMKTLAYVETRKLDRCLDAQQAVVESIELVASDLLSFYPETMPETRETASILLLIGAERGFCGDFNHALIRQLQPSRQAQSSGSPRLIAIGRKLHTLLDGDERVVAWIDGASAVEEITSVLNRLADEILSLQADQAALEVFCLFHSEKNGVVSQRLLPPFQGLAVTPPRFAHPPMTNLAPAVLLEQITDQYLFAALHSMLYTSLRAENYHRVSHLTGAVKHLDDQAEELTLRCNALRQEEIIEEIEVILLNAANVAAAPGPRE